MRTFVRKRDYLVENRQLLGSIDIRKNVHTLMEDNIKIKEKINSEYQESKKESDFIKESIKQFIFKDDQSITILKQIAKANSHSLY